MSKIYKKLRQTRIVVSMVCLVVLTAGLCGAGGFIGAFSRGISTAQLIPALLAGCGAWILFWTVATLLMGRIYCSTACPLGTLQDVVARLLHMRFHGPMTCYRYRNIPLLIRLLALVVFVEGVSLGVVVITRWMDPYADFARLFGVGASTTLTAFAGGAVIAAIVVVSAKTGGRTLCNTICPMGCALGALSSVALLRYDINPDLCIHCGACERTCKGRCINSTTSEVDNSRCVTCFDCVSVCPNNAIRWRVGQHRLQWPLLQNVDNRHQKAPATSANCPHVAGCRKNLTGVSINKENPLQK